MKILVSAIALSLMLAPAALYAAEEEPAKTDAEKSEQAKTPTLPVFNPTNLGAPVTRLGGATRSATGTVPRTEALVPEVAGHTLLAQPVLYWYLAGETDERIDFALIGVDPINPILEVTLAGPFAPGIQRIRLADHGVKLESGLEYQWFVRVVPNPDQRLYDRVVGGGIQRLEASADLDAKLAAAGTSQSHFVLAESGIWYDALDALTLQIEAAPTNADLRAQRTALFDQVGLEDVK